MDESRSTAADKYHVRNFELSSSIDPHRHHRRRFAYCPTSPVLPLTIQAIQASTQVLEGCIGQEVRRTPAKFQDS